MTVAAGVLDEPPVPRNVRITAARKRVAARVLDEPDLRMEIRWRRSEGVSIPKAVEDQAELLWEHAFAHGPAVSEQEALDLSTFTSKKRLDAAFRAFGCPAALLKSGALTKEAVTELVTLDQQWSKARAANRSKKYRQEATKRKITVMRKPKSVTQ